MVGGLSVDVGCRFAVCRHFAVYRHSTVGCVGWVGKSAVRPQRNRLACVELGNSRNNAQVAMDAATIDTAAKNRSNPIMSLRVGLMHFAFG